jgi:hypothetical protein
MRRLGSPAIAVEATGTAPDRRASPALPRDPVTVVTGLHSFYRLVSIINDTFVRPYGALPASRLLIQAKRWLE